MTQNFDFADGLLLLLIGLKLSGVWDASWWWVFSPIWLYCALVMVTYGYGIVLRRRNSSDSPGDADSDDGP
jgi:hypothetical protein